VNISEHSWGQSRAVDDVWALVAGMPTLQSGGCVVAIFRAFIDESYSPEGGSFVFAGYISTVDRWAEFTKEWEGALPQYGVLNRKTGKHRFKFKEMWQFDDRRKNIPKFFEIIERHAVLALSCHINIGEFEAAQDRIIASYPFAEWGDRLSPYHMAFRCLIDRFHNSRHLYSEFIPDDARVHFVFDDEIRKKRLIIREWDSYLEKRSTELRRLYDDDPWWRNDEEFLPLQAADLWAGALFRAYRSGLSGQAAMDTDKRDLGARTGVDKLAIEFSGDDLERALRTLLVFDGPADSYSVSYDNWDFLNQ